MKRPPIVAAVVMFAALSTFCELSQIRIWGRGRNDDVEQSSTRSLAPLPLYGLHGSGGGNGGRVIDARRDVGAAAGELRVSDFEVGQGSGVII